VLSAVTQAHALSRGEPAVALQLASRLIVPMANNFVERPWGGMRIRDFKRLCPLPEQVATTGLGLGEAFEIAAYDDDEESRLHPSQLRLTDRSTLSLPELLTSHGEIILGPEFVARYGRRFPLLPKTLDIKELLSVQGHPAGNTEAYIIIDAEPGATIRLGFSEDIDAREFRLELKEGHEQQKRLLDAFESTLDANVLQQHLKAWFAQVGVDVAVLEDVLSPALPDKREWSRAASLLVELKALYWRVLDRMNAIPVAAGQVIHNATPNRLLGEGDRLSSAEVHALGNPEEREILVLEVRRPGPTFRAWDNVRFPLRHVDIDVAVDALNLSKTEPSEFIVEPAPVLDRPDTLCSIDSDSFRIEHLRPNQGSRISVPEQQPHCLHVVRGAVVVRASGGTEIGSLSRGESAIVPIGVGGYSVTAAEPLTEVIKVSVPEGG